MPQRRTSIKELRKVAAHHAHNMDIRTDLKKTVKKFLLTVKNNKLDDAKAALKIVHKKIDKAAKRNIFHKKTAARRKSLYSRALVRIKA